MTVSLTLRPPRAAERDALNALMFSAKAAWGYDAAFMESARAELTLAPDDLAGHCCVACDGRAALGVALLVIDGAAAEIEQFFVAPSAQGRGIGRALFQWCLAAAAGAGATALWVTADPNAAVFYARMGMGAAGTKRSPSTGRVLPRLRMAIAPQASDIASP